MSSQAIQAELETNLRARRTEWVEARRADLSPELAQAIVEGRPMIGMTAEQLEVALGPASDVNTTRTADVVAQQAVYAWGERRYDPMYVYLENGIVVAIQD